MLCRLIIERRRCAMDGTTCHNIHSPTELIVSLSFGHWACVCEWVCFAAIIASSLLLVTRPTSMRQTFCFWPFFFLFLVFFDSHEKQSFMIKCLAFLFSLLKSMRIYKTVCALVLIHCTFRTERAQQNNVTNKRKSMRTAQLWTLVLVVYVNVYVRAFFSSWIKFQFQSYQLKVHVAFWHKITVADT